MVVDCQRQAQASPLYPKRDINALLLALTFSRPTNKKSFKIRHGLTSTADSRIGTHEHSKRRSRTRTATGGQWVHRLTLYHRSIEGCHCKNPSILVDTRHLNKKSRRPHRNLYIIAFQVVLPRRVHRHTLNNIGTQGTRCDTGAAKAQSLFIGSGSSRTTTGARRI
jgi:hypothetical protein